MQAIAFFHPTELGEIDQRFYLFHPAQGDVVQGLVLYIHPFAEEMNKARRMAALQARALAQAGYAVLQIDLLGCGDSSGDFGDATWEIWVSDVVQACHWLRRQSNDHGAHPDTIPLWLWGLRAGCLLAVEAASQLDEACHFLFWQPPSSGKLLLQQFLRLKVAGDMLSGHSKGVMQGIRHHLVCGSPVEIAGYMLSSELAMGLEQAVLAPPVKASQARRLEWFELSLRDDAILSPASANIITQWRQAGFNTVSQVLSGPAFWQTSEIEDAPALLTATTAAACASLPMAFREADIA